jgi:hypothetical protein
MGGCLVLLDIDMATEGKSQVEKIKKLDLEFQRAHKRDRLKPLCATL